MTKPYRIFGVELSPYSVKVRSYFRYKGVRHQWLLRNPDTESEYRKYARIPIVPLVVTPEDEGIQASTPIIERIEAEHPEPSVHPAEPVAAFVSALLEEFGDEWGNKWMFHYRWAREADQQACSKRLVAEMMPQLSGEQADGMAKGVVERMVGRVWFVGSSEQTAPQIEASYVEGIELLDRHLEGRPYLFGARPAFGDFGLWGQIYNATLDPTPAGLLKERAPRLGEWVQRMLEPKTEGEFEPWSALAPTLEPFLARQVGRLFLPWSAANAKAIADGEDSFEVDLDGEAWSQKPQKYHAKSLVAIREKYAAAASPELDTVLERTGCRR